MLAFQVKLPANTNKVGMKVEQETDQNKMYGGQFIKVNTHVEQELTQHDILEQFEAGTVHLNQLEIKVYSLPFQLEIISF